ncbi:MAG: hypothetical protein K0R99_3785 [Microbacterium sp.]|nr:hypothetical protein [Microbacterium sp.]
MSRPSSIRGKRIQPRVDALLDHGHTVAEVARITGVHESSAYRYSKWRMSHAVRALNDEPNILDLVSRLQRAADEARDARVHASHSGSATARTRAVQIESQILGKLLGELGVDDSRVADSFEECRDLISALGTFADEHPAPARVLADHLGTQPGTVEFGRALTTRIEKS